MFKVDYNLQAGFKMSKWADFLISAIRYENEVLKNSIAYLKVHHDQGAEIGAGYTWTKEEVINAMYEGKTFYTIIKEKTGEWKKGAIVALITKNGKSIITDSNSTDLDYFTNLQEL
ncbi:MAG: hypothetical protein M5U17_01180 [Ignavibacterium sp.]|jgi:hypothetical protein|nr:hypothetical protein [Ignavibacterium sp.]MDX9711153.1 hypothetical protein [Ignavibacteriaceae bacterium]